MLFSEYIIRNNILIESETKYQQELLSFLEILKTQKETKDLKKVRDAISYVCVKGSEKDQKKLYNEILLKFKNHAKQIKAKVNEASSFEEEVYKSYLPDEKPSIKDKALKAGAYAVGGAAALGGLAVGAGAVIAGGTLASIGLAALGMGMGGATTLGTLIGGGPVMAAVTKVGADMLGGKSPSEDSEIVSGLKKLNAKFKISDKVKSIKKNVETKIKNLKVVKTNKSNKTNTPKGSDKSTGYTGSNETIKGFSKIMNSMGWDFESTKDYDGYSVVWYSAEKQDGATNTEKGWENKIKELFKYVKKTQGSHNVWLTRWWIGGAKNPKYMVSVAFGRKPGRGDNKS